MSCIRPLRCIPSSSTVFFYIVTEDVRVVTLRHMMYAVDVVLVGDYKEGMQERLDE